MKEKNGNRGEAKKKASYYDQGRIVRLLGKMGQIESGFIVPSKTIPWLHNRTTLQYIFYLILQCLKTYPHFRFLISWNFITHLYSSSNHSIKNSITLTFTPVPGPHTKEKSSFILANCVCSARSIFLIEIYAASRGVNWGIKDERNGVGGMITLPAIKTFFPLSSFGAFFFFIPPFCPFFVHFVLLSLICLPRSTVHRDIETFIRRLAAQPRTTIFYPLFPVDLFYSPVPPPPTIAQAYGFFWGGSLGSRVFFCV